MNLPFLPQRRGDEIERATVKPVSLPDAKPGPPRQWTIPVSEGNTLAEFRSALERKYERRTWAIRIVNIVIATASSLTKIPELRMLKLNKPQIKKTMAKIDIGKKIDRVLSADGWEAGVWALVAIAGIVAGIFDGTVEYIAAGVAAGVKAGFQTYKARQKEAEE